MNIKSKQMKENIKPVDMHLDQELHDKFKRKCKSNKETFTKGITRLIEGEIKES